MATGYTPPGATCCCGGGAPGCPCPVEGMAAAVCVDYPDYPTGGVRTLTPDFRAPTEYPLGSGETLGHPPAPNAACAYHGPVTRMTTTESLVITDYYPVVYFETISGVTYLTLLVYLWLQNYPTFGDVDYFGGFVGWRKPLGDCPGSGTYSFTRTDCITGSEFELVDVSNPTVTIGPCGEALMAAASTAAARGYRPPPPARPRICLYAERVEHLAGCSGFRCRHHCTSPDPGVRAALGDSDIVLPADECQTCPGYRPRP